MRESSMAIRAVHEVSAYYAGSRFFSGVAEWTGVSIDQVNYVVSQLIALALALLFRTVLHTSYTNAAVRHGFGLIVGLLIGSFCFGMQAIHLAGLPALCYIVIRTCNPQIMQRMVLAVALVYLSCIHLQRQLYDYGSYSLDVTAPLMVVTQKVTSLAFSLHDGLCRSDSEMNTNQRLYAVRTIPNPLEFFSYVLHFPSLMAGPALFYKDYVDFIDGSHLKNALNANTQREVVVVEPSPTAAVVRKVLLALLFAAVFIRLQPTFHIEGAKEADFVENTTIVYKFWYLSVATLLVRFKYYFAWLLADAICNNCGIGFEGFDASGRSTWNKFSNIQLAKFEFGSNLKESIDAWNLGTNRWLRMIVYERVDKHAIVLTYALSALWHGFYPGYYMTFANGALFTLAARTMRRTIRHYFTGNVELKLYYDVATFTMTRLVMTYVTFTFVLLEFWSGVRIYLHMYLCLHIAAVIALVIVPRIVPKANPGDSSHLSAAANGSFASALIRQASPITSSVSNHHD